MKRLPIVVLLFLCCPLFAQNTETVKPKFERTTSESVTLRYHFQAGQKVALESSLRMALDLTTGGRKSTMAVDLQVTGQYTVRELKADGNALLEFVFTRIHAFSRSPQKVEYDSADPKKNPPAFSRYGYYLHTPIPVTVSALGAVTAADASSVARAMRAAGQRATAEEIENQVREFTKSSFLRLPDAPVRAGGSFNAGESVTPVAQLGLLATRVRYRVAAVAADKKTALLEPDVSFDFKEVDLSSSRQTGWVLFDLEKGNVSRSFTDQRLAFTIMVEKKPVSYRINSTVFYKNNQ